MEILAILLLATIMAIFGVLGYLKGSRWAFIALLILLVAFILVENQSDIVVLALNGMYTGVMLVLNGGLGAIASGDFEAVQEVYQQIEPLFTDTNENLALLLVVFGAVGVGLLLSLVIKSKPSVWGMIWGLVYGYILSAVSLPLIFSNLSLTLPVPILRPMPRSTAATAATAGRNSLDQLFASLAQEQNVQIIGILIGAFIVLLLLLTVRSGVKSGAKKKG